MNHTLLRARILITLKPADLMWLTIAGLVVGFDLTCKRDATLSHAFDRYLLDHPWLARAVVVFTAAHLINALPIWCDPWEWAWYADLYRRGMWPVRKPADSM